MPNRDARRRWAAWMVAVLVLLAPFRGWAHTAMHMTMHSAGPAAPAAVAMPCHDAGPLAHGAGVHDAAAPAAPDGAPATGVDAPSTAACAMCDLCHGAALPAATAPDAARPDGHPPCVAATPAGHGSAAFGGPFRPPRG